MVPFCPFVARSIVLHRSELFILFLYEEEVGSVWAPGGVYGIPT
jgi:hypothetical protein